MEANDLPYRAEYAKSSRSKCRNCKTQIAKETLRLAAMVQSTMFDGKIAEWYHMSCFFGIQHPKTVGDIAHLESLRFEDQEKIIEKMNSAAGAVPEKKGEKRAAAAAGGSGTCNNIALKDFAIEYAKSGRTSCRICNQKILKDEVRICKKDFDSVVGKRSGRQNKWHHIECFARLRTELQYYLSGDKLPGFKTLKAKDQKNVKTQLPAITQEDVPEIKKPKVEDEAEENETLDKQIKQQYDVMFKYRDLLKTDFNKKELMELLEYNDQNIPTGYTDSILDLLSDLMTFGALEKCSNCKDGQFVFNKSGYICQGDLSEWAKCMITIEEPKRKPFKIPQEFKGKDTFKGYKYVPRIRKFRFVASTEHIKKEKEEEYTGPKVDLQKPALYEMRFILFGLRKTEMTALTAEIKKLGGVVQEDYSGGPVMALISTQAKVKNADKHYHITNAKKEDIHVVSTEFVEEAKDYVGKIPELIKKTSICTWGSDPNTRMPTRPEKSTLKSKSMFTKSVPKSVTMKIKGGGVVEPDSGLQHDAHVYQQGSDKWTAVLSLTDLQTQRNSFYKLQILESDANKRYWVFRSWGRIATTIGGHKLIDCDSLNEAKDKFRRVYENKTGNKWENRTKFTKIPGKMYLIDLYDGEEESMEIEETDVESKHPKQVQDTIFDVNSMKPCTKEFELDQEKMPLGKLSKKQLQSGFTVLSELEKLIDSTDPAESKFIDCCNRFYTFIPHSFGVENPPLINTHEMVKEKMTMLNSLLEMEIPYNLMKNTHAKGGNSSVDGHYEQLKTEIDIDDKDSEELKLIKENIKNTEGYTLAYYSPMVDDIFPSSP